MKHAHATYCNILVYILVYLGHVTLLHAATPKCLHIGEPTPTIRVSPNATGTALSLDCPKPDDCDLTDNDANFWNESGWWTPTYLTHDLPEIPIDISVTATGACNKVALQFRYQLFLDMDGNGSLETVVDSDNLPPASIIFFDNAKNPNYTGGTARNFDARTVPNPALDRYRFALEITATPSTTKASLRFNTAGNPTQYVFAQLPHGLHKIRWTVRDACNNETSCEQVFEVRDCQKPTVVCKPLTVNLLPTQTITLWASDFLEYALDNLTKATDLKLALSAADTTKFFPLDRITRLPINSLTFTCSNLGTNPVKLWAMDQRGNYSYCQVVLLLQDNAQNCSGGGSSLYGTIQTEAGRALSGVYINLVPTLPAFPPITLSNPSNTKGEYILPNSWATSMDVKIQPEQTDNPLNGVTTLDLALIQRHILGVNALNSPYKIIAADANRSGTITAFDVVELRKLILGIYDELPNNKSWRFVAKHHVFPNPASPFVPKFPEEVTVGEVRQKKGDFWGIKVGDVNGSNIANNLAGNEDRSAWPADHILIKDHAVLPGDAVEILFEGETALLGQQFTLEHPGLQLLEIVSRSPFVDQDNFGKFPDRQLLTYAWNSTQSQGERPAFALRFRALEAGRLSQMLHLSDAITPSEAYALGNSLEQPVFLRPTLQFAPSEAADAVQLLQNQPNPFGLATSIPFYLPQAGTAKLRIFDASGKLLHTQNSQLDQGWHQWTVSKAALGAQTGQLAYTLETNGTVLSKTMLHSH